MTSWKGFLDRRRDGSPRVTRGQLTALRRAVGIALDDSREPADVVAVARRVALDALDRFSRVDRSCATCDLERGGHCLEWRQDIPGDDAVDEGCDRHSTDGAPF